MVTINNAHNLDALNYVLGEFKSLSANTHKHREYVVIDGQGNRKAIDSDVPDAVSIIGTLESGVSVNVHIVLVQKGTNHPEGTTWYIYGEKGTLKLEVPTLMFGIGPAQLFQFKEESGGWVEIDVEKTNATAGIYEAFGKGDAKGFVTFEQAVVRHRMVEAIFKSARDGTRESYKTTF